MPDEQETGFTFVDKRQGTEAPAQNGSGEPTEAPAEAASPSTDRGRASSSPFQVPHLSTTDRILMCINWLHEGAWIALGLVQDPATEKIEQDLEGARIAIDSIAFLAEKVDAKLDEATRRDLNNLVRDLRLNFVQQQSRAAQPSQ